jgi:4a-hydroxytetrahydrobiopterin dehydratase
MDIVSLSAKSCKACTTKPNKLSDTEIAHYLTLLPSWQLEDGKLRRQLKVKDFITALKLANRIGDLAEQENHHPDLLVSWGLLGITIFTHSVNGLTENDFILAAKTNGIID